MSLKIFLVNRYILYDRNALTGDMLNDAIDKQRRIPVCEPVKYKRDVKRHQTTYNARMLLELADQLISSIL